MTPIERSPWELRAVWAQAARVEAMRAARRAAEAEADDEATDDEAEAPEAGRGGGGPAAAGLHLSPSGCPLAAAVCSRHFLVSAGSAPHCFHVSPFALLVLWTPVVLVVSRPC